MFRGDISNEISPKLFFVVEGLITHVAPENEKRASKARSRKKWKDLVSVTDIDSMMVAHLWDILWRTPYSFELITIESGEEGWYEALEKKFDRFNVPYSAMMGFDDVDALAQHIVFMPNILRIYHGNEGWAFKFGRLGEHIGDVQIFQVS